jgi:histidine triad (HIT) family protein
MKSQEKDCIFCKIAKGKVKAELVSETNNFFAMKDINQDIKGHTLIIPKKHHVTLLDLPDKLGNELLNFEKKVASELLEQKKGDGFNILMNNLEPAGQVVKHAHIHLIPRKEGDGLKIIS